ncbi:Rieske 2Fe-2S domain-containing protein [Nanchangia anserum]|uniref:Non-heme iron oxygenase ferredoxin subunit n=1 Tax=Nanchangia anserum TaxID=2692125 RepID=A0A8I0GAN0_9ACTO|nr:non-heme iron oxygenase ferredoxin subunit [Nanchangia anserum]
MSFQHACSTADIGPAEALSVTLSTADATDVAVAIVRDSDGTWHAIGDRCTHGDVLLSEGEVEDGSIECWGHSARFDLTTGTPTLPATQPTPVYPLSIDEDRVLVDVDHPTQA